MQFSEQWLRQWVNPQLSTEELVAQLTMAGLEVDGTEPASGDFSRVVVGQILSAEPHPDADKLGVCEVDIGAEEALSIVCGAPNAVAGMKVPVALVGAVLPGGFKIKKAKLRGVPSAGMLCAEVELGMAEQSDGLWALPEDAPVGQCIREYLGLDDQIIEVDLTPNRGDCLSLLGLAREVAVLNDLDFKSPEIEPVMATVNDTFPVTVSEPAACPRYLGRVIRGINPQATTPLWMVEKLRRGGIRSIDPVVDVTNYVLLELGQPMHAFDLDQLQGGINVRLAVAEERLTLLDEQEMTLDPQTLVIADDRGPLAIAGIMGGKGSGVTVQTSNLFLECAFFEPIHIAGRARSYGLHTDSSHRFERGVDYELQDLAMERATALLSGIVGGEVGPVIDVTDSSALPTGTPITLRQKRVESVLGISLDKDTIVNTLTRLGMAVTELDDAVSWEVVAPAYRFDVAIEADLFEEIGRVFGYNNLPTVMPEMDFVIEQDDEGSPGINALRQRLVTLGYQEAICYSFVEPAVQAVLEPDVAPMRLLNPISEDLSVMRTSLWAGLVQAAAYNRKRQQQRIRLFETGQRFIPQGDELVQQTMVAGLISGPVAAESWSLNSRDVDFFDLKGDVEALLELGGNPQPVEIKVASHSALHPGQSAQVWRGGELVGWLGQLHPEHQKKLACGPCFVFELELSAVLAGSVPGYQDISRFPEVRRDIAVLVDTDCSAGSVLSCVRQAAGEQLTDTTLFDLYQGENLPKNKKSLALTLTFQHPSRTLKDEEINAAVDNIVLALKQQVNGVLRD